MTGEWMLRALAAGALLGLAAWALERVAGWFHLPRRGVWAAAMAGSLLLPALSLWLPGALPRLGLLPGWPRGAGADAALLEQLLARAGAAAGEGGGAAGAAAHPLAGLLAAGWLTGSLAMCAVVGAAYARMRRARRGGVPAELPGATVLVAGAVGPAVVGLLHPAVLVPRWVLAAPAGEQALIVRHEREHIAAGDHWLLALATLAVALVPWCLPLWWQHRRLRLAVETDCDARVLARGGCRRSYGQVLLRTAGSSPALPWLSPAWGEPVSHLERRILAMTEKQPRHRLLRSLPLLGLGVAVVLAACEAAGRGQTPTGPADAKSPVQLSGDRLRIRGPEGKEPLTFVDEVRVITLEDVDPEDIAMVRVLKGEKATERYGPEGENGAVQVFTKAWAAVHPGEDTAGAGAEVSPVRVRVEFGPGGGTGEPMEMAGELRAVPGRPPLDPDRVTASLYGRPGAQGRTPLYLVDGARVASIEGIDPVRIEKINVLKGKPATDAYGADGADGVVYITLKK